MHKIGILTFANVPNFGANLQALSTICYLKNEGLNPIIIKWEPEDFEHRFIKIRNLEQPAEHFRFVKQYLPQTSLCRNEEDICRVIEREEIDAIIIGSDAVLQHIPLLARIQFPTKTLYSIYKVTSERIYPNSFWGSFYCKEKTKIPMAMMSVSSQNSKYYFFGRNTCKAMQASLNNFSYLSVRDQWTKNMLLYITSGEIVPEVTPDPVFAFNKNCASLIPSKEEVLDRFGLPDDYVLVSMKSRLLDNETWMNDLRDAFKRRNLDCVALPMPTGINFVHNFQYEIKPPLSPLYWYALIKYARGYIGENMHPIVVSLANAIPLFCFDTYGVLSFSRLYCNEKSSKIYDILYKFDLLDNRVNASSRFWKCPLVEDVVEKIVTFEKDKCANVAAGILDDYYCMMNNILTKLGRTNESANNE